MRCIVQMNLPLQSVTGSCKSLGNEGNDLSGDEYEIKEEVSEGTII